VPGKNLSRNDPDAFMPLNFGAGYGVEKEKNDISREWCVKHYGGYEDPNGPGRWTYGE